MDRILRQDRKDVEYSAFKWSFSSWATYNTCPAKWKFKYIQKCPSLPAGPAAARGTEIHDNIAGYVACSYDDPEKLHPAINKEKMLPVFDALRYHPNGERYVEVPIYFSSEWQDTVKGLRWGVAILDAVRCGGAWVGGGGGLRVENDPHEGKVSVYEWKSGTPKDDHKEQRHLYATAALARWKQYDEVSVTTYYVEGKADPVRLRVKRSAEEKLQELWNGRIDGMRNDKIKAPRPGYYCNWCDYSKAKGGPCMF